MTTPSRDELLSVPQAAAALGLARQSVYTAIYQRRLHLAHPGRPYRIARAEVERYRAAPKGPGHRIDWGDELQRGARGGAAVSGVEA